MTTQSYFSTEQDIAQKLLLLTNPKSFPSVTIAAGQTSSITTIPHSLKKTPYVSGMWTRDNPNTNPTTTRWFPMGQTNDGIYGTAGGDLNSQWQIYADKNNIYVEVYCWSVNAAFTAYFTVMAFKLEVFK